MDYLFSAVILGVVEGLTEFLPVSSTGHLILVGHLIGFTGLKAATFEVVIQLGAILAVVVMYRDRFLGLLLPNHVPPPEHPVHYASQEGAAPPPQPVRRFAGMRGLMMLFVTCLPASVVGLLFHDTIKTQLFGPVTVAWALGVGAVMILVVESLRLKPHARTLDDMTFRLALGVGLFQCLALWPGFSRSAATIMGAMLCGADRTVAAEYSFIAAAPIMVAASALDLAGNLHLFGPQDLIHLAVGFVVSFLSAWAAVKVFIRLLGKVTLRPFAYYRLAMAPLVLLFWPE